MNILTNLELLINTFSESS